MNRTSAKPAASNKKGRYSQQQGVHADIDDILADAYRHVTSRTDANGIETITLSHEAPCRPIVVSIDTSNPSYPYTIHYNDDGAPHSEYDRMRASGVLAFYFRSLAIQNRRLYESKVSECREKEAAGMFLAGTVKKLEREKEEIKNSQGIWIL
jgi:hypothetical protein